MFDLQFWGVHYNSLLLNHQHHEVKNCFLSVTSLVVCMHQAHVNFYSIIKQMSSWTCIYFIAELHKANNPKLARFFFFFGGNLDILGILTLNIMLYIWVWNISVCRSYILASPYPTVDVTAIYIFRNSVGNSRWGANLVSSLKRALVSPTTKICLLSEKKL